MIRYLLDTDTFSALLRFPQGQVAQRIMLVGDSTVATSVIVACELRFGAELKKSKRLHDLVEGLLARLPVLALEERSAVAYGELRRDLTTRGALIGANDLLIGAQDLSLGLTLVTHNTREFARIPGLSVEDWLA